MRVKERAGRRRAIIHFRVVKNYRGKKVPVRGDIFLGLRDTPSGARSIQRLPAAGNPQDCSDSGIFIARR